MKKTFVLILILFLFPFCFAKTQKASEDSYTYSTQYFDYLIECAETEKKQMLEEIQQKNKSYELELTELQDDIITDDFHPFKLKIEENVKTPPYKDTFKRIDTKTVIPITDKFSIIQDSSKTRNKYNSHDYKILAGAEYQPFSFLVFSSGLETNYRGLDQNPASKKIYFSPAIHFKDKISLKFHNKMNILNYSSDHDIGLNISPFKSKTMDFGVYSGISRKHNGSITESINFATNFYF